MRANALALLVFLAPAAVEAARPRTPAGPLERQARTFLARPETAIVELRELVDAPADDANLTDERDGAALILHALADTPQFQANTERLKAALAPKTLAGLRSAAKLPQVRGELARAVEQLAHPAPGDDVARILDRLFGASVSHVQLGGTIAMTDAGGGLGRADTRWTEGLGSTIKKREVLFGGGKDSSQITLADLKEVARVVQRNLDEGHVPVLTQGTDTLDTTGLVLSQLFADRLIVLTGSFHPFNAPGSDGPGNFEGAMRVAALAGRRNVPQVPYVVMNGKIHLASSLVKLDTDFTDGRRGFDSYAGAVGRIEDGKVRWDEDFLKNFERDRAQALRETKEARARIAQRLADGGFRFGDAEIAFVNRFTPPDYLGAVLDRLAKGESKATIFHGILPDDPELDRRILGLEAAGRPVFVERSVNARDVGRPFPSGLEPFQLVYKLAVWMSEASGAELDRVLGLSLAGERAKKPVPSTLRPPIATGNFYEGDNVRRGFLLFQQNLPLMVDSLREELERLRHEKAEGHETELIIESVGNGHVHVGEPMLELLVLAKRSGVPVTLVTRVQDASPNTAYEIGRRLAGPDVSVKLSGFPGREYLRRLASPRGKSR